MNLSARTRYVRTGFTKATADGVQRHSGPRDWSFEVRPQAIRGRSPRWSASPAMRTVRTRPRGVRQTVSRPMRVGHTSEATCRCERRPSPWLPRGCCLGAADLAVRIC